MTANAYALLDAEALSRQHPATFWAPGLDPASRSVLAALASGDYVKVSLPGERFWCRVEAVHPGDPRSYTALVDNYLVDYPLAFGTPLLVERRHIFDYLPCAPFARELQASRAGGVVADLAGALGSNSPRPAEGP